MKASYVDIETAEVLTYSQLKEEYNQLKADGHTEAESFEMYLAGCLEKGTLEVHK